MAAECIVCDGLGCEFCPSASLAATLQAQAERADRLEKVLRELSDCVLRGWTEPAFARGSLHNRAVEIARASGDSGLKIDGEVEDNG